MVFSSSKLKSLVEHATGPARAEVLFRLLKVPAALLEEQGNGVSRAVMAQALNMVLFDALLERVPDARAYTQDQLDAGRQIVYDHGAVRTVALAGMGALPAGEEAIVRLLKPLGYACNGIYPLDRLKMLGRSYVQQDHPEEIAQFFVSELYPERFSDAFQKAAVCVTRSSRDPLGTASVAVLAELEAEGSISLQDGARILPELAACFDRQHDVPSLADYECLLAESPEMAWIATEGNAFNHATDRVEDVHRLAEEQRKLGRNIKEAVEVSQSGRVRQTAFRAAQVWREFRGPDGATVRRQVPGSFYEFITRLPIVDGGDGKSRLDLAFDSSNAQGIFKMTAPA